MLPQKLLQQLTFIILYDTVTKSGDSSLDYYHTFTANKQRS